MKISGAIFDLDGTLVNSMPFYVKTGKKYLKKIGLKNHFELAKLFLTKTSQELACIFRNDFNIQKSEQEIINEINAEFYDLYANKIKAKKGAVQFLSFLKSKNIPIAILTASDKEIVIPCAKRNGVFSFVDKFVFCSEFKTSKRKPEIFYYTLNLLNSRAEETFVFEDALYSIQTAKNAKFKICGIFDSWCKNDWNEIKIESDIYGKNFLEIKEKFKDLIT